ALPYRIDHRIEMVDVADIDGLVGVCETERLERGFVHGGRNAVRDGMAEYREPEPRCHCFPLVSDSPGSSSTEPAKLGSSASLASVTSSTFAENAPRCTRIDTCMPGETSDAARMARPSSVVAMAYPRARTASGDMAVRRARRSARRDREASTRVL